MSRPAMEELMDQWMNDESFRAQMRSDPEGTVRGRNIDLSTDEWAALRAVDWNLPDEQLQARVSKAGG